MFKSFLLFLISSSIFSQSNYYHYEDYNLRIRDIEYTRFILPQMRNILVEIPYNVKDLLPKHKNLIQFTSSFYLSKIKFNSTKYQQKLHLKEINKVSKTCENYLKFYYKTVSSEQLSFKLLKSLKLLSFNCIKVKNIILQLKFASKYLPKLWPKEALNFSYLISTLYLSSIDTVKYSFKAPMQNDYNNFLTDFYFPLLRIYQQKLKGKNLFKRNIDRFNNSLNIFLMEMEKKDTQYLPENYIKKVKLLLNRWNSILKVILRKK